MQMYFIKQIQMDNVHRKMVKTAGKKINMLAHKKL